MADSLSRSEVESLLSALDPKPPGSVPEPAGTGNDIPPSRTASRSSSSLARSAVLFCESVRKRIESAWEPLLREPVRLKRHMPRTLAFSELLDRHQTSHFGFLLESKHGQSDLILFIERALAVPLIARLSGNSGVNNHPGGLTELEFRLLKRMLRECFREPLPFSRWWLTALDRFDFAAERTARSGRTSWWSESWELKTDSIRGNIQLAGEWEFLSSSDGGSPALTPQAETRAVDGTSELIVEIDSIAFDEDSIARLRSGDTFPAVDYANLTARVLVEGESRWTGRPGLHNGQKVVEIVQSSNRPD